VFATTARDKAGGASNAGGAQSGASNAGEAQRLRG